MESPPVPAPWGGLCQASSPEAVCPLLPARPQLGCVDNRRVTGRAAPQHRRRRGDRRAGVREAPPLSRQPSPRQLMAGIGFSEAAGCHAVRGAGSRLTHGGPPRRRLESSLAAPRGCPLRAPALLRTQLFARAGDEGQGQEERGVRGRRVGGLAGRSVSCDRESVQEEKVEGSPRGSPGRGHSRSQTLAKARRTFLCFTRSCPMPWPGRRACSSDSRSGTYFALRLRSFPAEDSLQGSGSSHRSSAHTGGIRLLSPGLVLAAGPGAFPPASVVS